MLASSLARQLEGFLEVPQGSESGTNRGSWAAVKSHVIRCQVSDRMLVTNQLPGYVLTALRQRQAAAHVVRASPLC
jgi:hypothetical protein